MPVERLVLGLIIVMTVVSMYLTAQFGYNSGGLALAIGLPAVTFAAVLLWYMAPLVRSRAQSCALMLFAVFFSLIDAYSNVGASFALKENELVGTANKNEVADNLRTEISRKEKRLAEIQGEQAWKPEYAATGAWEAEIKNLEGHMIFGRSKQCSDQTLKDTFKHCEKWRSAQAGLAYAQGRETLQAEFDHLSAQLKSDKAALVDHGGTHVSETATQIERLTQLLSFDLAPGEDIKEHAYLLMTALLGVVFSVAPAVMSYALALHRGHAPAPAYQPSSARVADNPYLPDYRAPDARQAYQQPSPLKPYGGDTHNTSVVVSGRTVPAESLQTIHLHMARARAILDDMQTT